MLVTRSTFPKPELEPPAHFPKKRLGQHFLKDPNTARIVADGVTEDDIVLEIGPGHGFLTTFLAQRAKSVYVVEFDRDLMRSLSNNLREFQNVSLHSGDALSFDWSKLSPAPNKLIANLPYNIASPLILKLLEEQHCVKVMRFMVQYEVGRRMAADVGTKDYAAYAVLVQLFATARIVHKVSPRVFDPPPRVHSAVVEMRRHDNGTSDYGGVKRLVLAAFKSRRKQLANNLPEPVRREAPRVLRDMGHRPDVRAEDLTPEDFVALYREISWAM